MKTRVYISLCCEGCVCKLGAYCLRAAGKRKGDVFRRRQAEQEWGESMSRADKAGERSGSGYWSHTVFIYHPTLDSRDKWRVRYGIPAAGEFLCLCIQRLQFFIQRKPSLLQSVKTPFFTLLRVVGKLLISASICILFWWFFYLSMLSRSFDSFVCFPDEF